MAKILADRELVLNKGSADGVEVGMRFVILNRNGADIRDPETGEILGSVDLEKTMVKVVRVHERLAIARTFRTIRSAEEPLAAFGIPGQLVRPPQTVVESLQTDEQRLKDELSEEDSSVKLGDPAVQVIGDEYESDDAN
ncbi:hypothetical protein [Microtetraspora sp. NBRC 13810]|uniref:hypothetical protein n=1 Tax=Microtetraspora sp. NBRC 13810 TaxID=3030990 RepID=UPI00255704E6|nr:hypothetical protein [Microtetraspora sp. NBRC 13810]